MKHKLISQSVRLDPTSYAKLKVISELEGRSINKQMIRILEQFLRNYESEHGVIEVTEE